MSTAQGAVRQSDWIAVSSEIDLAAALSLTTQHACKARVNLRSYSHSSDILRCTENEGQPRSRAASRERH